MSNDQMLDRERMRDWDLRESALVRWEEAKAKVREHISQDLVLSAEKIERTIIICFDKNYPKIIKYNRRKIHYL